MLDPKHFIIVAGEELVQSLREETERRIPKTGLGYASDNLCALQRERAGRMVLGVEIVQSMYGHSVRYDSGLQNFGILASKRYGNIDGSYESAERFAKAWVSHDPTRRYAWRRRTAAD